MFVDVLAYWSMPKQEKQLPAHQAQEDSVQSTAAGDAGKAAADSGSQGGDKGKSDPSASLAAWAEITSLPTGKAGGGVTGGGNQGEGQQQEQQQQQQPGEQTKEQPTAAGGGPQEGHKFVTVELRVPKVRLVERLQGLHLL